MAGNSSQPSAGLWKDMPFLLSAALGFSVCSAHFYSFGLFLEPLEREFGWNRAEISAALMIVSAVGIIAAPLMGLAIDRWGSRRIGLPGVVAYGCSFALLSLSGPSIWTFWGCYLLVALSIVPITATVWTAAVAARFDVGKRGLAIALALCGAAYGMLVAPISAEYLISNHGWRVAYLGMSLLFVGGALPMILIFFRDPRVTDPLPVATPELQEAVAAPGPSRAECLRSWRYWSLVIVSLISAVGALALTAHFVPMVTGTGISRETAAWAASTIGIASFTGRLLEGWLLDRFKGPAIGAVSLMLPSGACLLILFGEPSTAWAVSVALVLGLAVGAEINIMAYLTSRYFGVRHYGLLFGIVYSMVVAGGGLGPLLGGVIFDLTHDYHVLAWTVLPMCMLCAVMVLMMGPYPEEPRAQSQPAAEPALA